MGDTSSGEYYPLTRGEAKEKFQKPVHLRWIHFGIAIVTENSGEDDRRFRINAQDLFGQDKTEWYMGMSDQTRVSDRLKRGRDEKELNRWLGLVEPETTPIT